MMEYVYIWFSGVSPFDLQHILCEEGRACENPHKTLSFPFLPFQPFKNKDPKLLIFFTSTPSTSTKHFLFVLHYLYVTPNITLSLSLNLQSPFNGSSWKHFFETRCWFSATEFCCYLFTFPVIYVFVHGCFRVIKGYAAIVRNMTTCSAAKMYTRTVCQGQSN